MKAHRYLSTATEICLTVIISVFFYTLSPSFANADQLKTETHKLQPFAHLSVQSGVKVVFKTSTEHSLSVEAQEDVFPYVKVEQKNNHLVLGLENKKQKFSFRKLFMDAPVTFTLRAPSPESIEISGAGKFTADNLLADAFELRVSGSGNVDIERIQSRSMAHISVSGSGDAQIRRVESKTLDVEVNGSGNIDLGAATATHFNTRISGSGNVQYGFVEVREAQFSIAGSGYIGVGEIETEDFDARISGSGLISAKGVATRITTKKAGSGSFNISDLIKTNKQTLNFIPLEKSKTLYL